MKRLRRWWRNPTIPLEPTTRLRLAWLTLLASVVGWPLSTVTFAAGEPATVLALSWLAIALTAVDVLATSDVRSAQDE